MLFSKLYKIFFIIWLYLLPIAVKAQAIANSADAEAKSIQLYYNADWPQLTQYGEKAIIKGYDYFYMRMRVGIACFEQKKYIKAIRHFEKAVQFNSSDSLALEYLYYSYIFSGRRNEARALTEQLPASLKNKIKPPKNKLIESIYTEGGIGLSKLNDIYKTIDLDGQYNVYGETTVAKNMGYWHIGIGHQLGNSWSVYQGYSNIGIDMLRGIKIGNKDTFNTYKLTQHDYYIGATTQFNHITISPAFHLINVSFGKMNAEFNTTSNKFDFITRDTSFINYVTSLSLSKCAGIFTYGLNTSYSQLNSYNQLQTGLSLTYFPFGNTNFYGTSMLVYLNENNTSRLIFGQKIGAKIIPKLWAEGGITYGNLQNYHESNAFIVFNTGDKILYKYELALVSPISKHIELSVRFDYFNRENAYYRSNTFDKIESISVNYNTQTIVGGLKWKL